MSTLVEFATTNWKILASSILAIFVVSRLMKYQDGLKRTAGLPTMALPFMNMDIPGAVWNGMTMGEGVSMHWRFRHNFYSRFKSEIFATIPYIFGLPEIWTNNVDVARQVAVGGHKSSFLKPKEASRILLLWGMNLLAADQETWRKHRRVMGPAFNNTLYNYVLKKSKNFYDDMIIGEGWADKTRIEVPSIHQLTFKFTLLVIGTCGFGFSFSWDDPPALEDGNMTVQEALRIVGRDSLLQTSLPAWVFHLPIKRLQQSRTARNILLQFMREQVSDRKHAAVHNEAGQGAENAFSMLVKANEDLEGKYSLDDTELIGNVFILLLAGHETTAHTIATVLGYLAIHQDIQQDVYEQIMEVLGNGRPESIEELFRMDKLLGCFFESLRLFPTAHIMIRESYEDTVLNIPDGENGNKTMPIPKGTRINVDMIGIQYNPRYFPSPFEFRPSRWAGISPDSEEFTAFSIGARACIGRRFAIIESLAFLALLFKDWKVSPTLGKGESVEQWEKKVMDGKMGITLGLNEVPITFIRRE